MLKVTGNRVFEAMPLPLNSTKEQAQSFLVSNIRSIENTTFYRADSRPPEEIARNGFTGTASTIPGEIRLFGNNTVFASSTLEDCKKFIGMIDHEDNPREYHFYKFNIRNGEGFSFNDVQDKSRLVNALAILAKEECGTPMSEAVEYARFAIDEHYANVKEVQIKGPISAADIDYLESATYGE